jgi:hypothetical protein
MTTLDDRFRPMAARMIAQYGKAMTLKVTTEGAYDPATATASQSVASTSIKGVVDAPARADFEAGLAKAGDRVVYVAAQDANPSLGDVLSMDGDDWTVVSVRSTFSGEQTALHALIVRK